MPLCYNGVMEKSEQAKQFIKGNKRLLFEKFAGNNRLQPSAKPVSIFMAGSPGAGKTEYSKRFVEKFKGDIVRIDADEIREIIPMYNGANSDMVQGAAAIGVDILYNYAVKKNYNLLLDGTFAKFNIAKRNIEQSIKKNRAIVICYLYQDPTVAWDFTQKREKLEGRTVPKHIFIDAFINSRKNVAAIKNMFKNKVEVYLIVKDYTNNIRDSYFDVHIDSYLKNNYTGESLSKIL